MAITGNIEFKYSGTGLKNLEKLMRHMPKGVTIGVHSDEISDDGGSVAKYATANEFGTKKIPERPFMRSTFKAKRRHIESMMAKFVKSFIAGRKFRRDQFLDIIGAFMTDEIKKRINDSKRWAKPNTARTIRRKTRAGKVGDHPLIDTGRLLNSITWKPIK